MTISRLRSNGLIEESGRKIGAAAILFEDRIEE